MSEKAEPISDEGMAGLMVRTSLRNSISHHRDGVPLTANFERARKMINPSALAETVASGMRHVLVDHIEGKPPSPDLMWNDIEQNYTFNQPPVENLESELIYMEQNVDQTSYTSMATLSDLYMAAGYPIEARVWYEKALKSLRGKDTIVSE